MITVVVVVCLAGGFVIGRMFLSGPASAKAASNTEEIAAKETHGEKSKENQKNKSKEGRKNRFERTCKNRYQMACHGHLNLSPSSPI